MQMFHAPAVLHEFRSQPVVQLGMLWRRAAPAKVENGRDERRVEMSRPDMIHSDTSGERIFAAGHPTGERTTPASALGWINRAEWSVSHAVGRERGLAGVDGFLRGGDL